MTNLFYVDGVSPRPSFFAVAVAIGAAFLAFWAGFIACVAVQL